jgi:hypothetical protein
LIQRGGSGRLASFHRRLNPQPGHRAGLHRFRSTIMTGNDTTNSSSLIDPSWWFARDREFEKLCDSIRPENKAAVFDILAQAGVTSVEVIFDGYGDSGQIEDITAKAGDKDVVLPTINVEVARADWGIPDIVRLTHPLPQAIEQLAYDFLRETHAGWENNEGAYGDFQFDVTERSITLNYNERIETSEYTRHVF